MNRQFDIISSSDNQTVKLYVKLSKSKKERCESRRFVLEGARLCMEAVRLLRTEIVIITEGSLKRFENDLADFGGRVLVITDELAEKLSDTRTTQGVFAICEIPEQSSAEQIISEGGRYIVLNTLQDPTNIGTILRTADAVGIDAVILCSCCDLYNPKVIRGTMGSIFRVKTLELDYTEAMECFKKKGVPTFAAVVDKDAENLTECDFSHGGAVVTGNEGNGLSEEDIALCDKKLTIKMHGNIESLNAAMATGIIAWEMLR